MTAADRPNHHESGGLRRTALQGRHLALGARLVPFAGWEMPVQYAGIIQEHRAVRNAAGLFDLGHMGQVEVDGPAALPFLQSVTTNDVSVLEPGQAQYALLPNDQGGVVDDVIVYRNPEGRDGYMVVVNASNREKDVAWLQANAERHPPGSLRVEDVSDRIGMVAIQGPRAVEIVSRVTDADLTAVGSFAWCDGTVAGVPVSIARTGYTGEDGFEVFAPDDRIGEIWDALLLAGEPDGIVPVGLGARDSLRLEARMPLYGQELADDIGPLEAGLGWAVKLGKGEFVGRDEIAAMKASGPPRRTVGFTTLERSGAPRTGYPVQVDGREVGRVTSGAWSPTLEQNIGLALVECEVVGVGKPLSVVVRGKAVPAVQVATPFYKRTR